MAIKLEICFIPQVSTDVFYLFNHFSFRKTCLIAKHRWNLQSSQMILWNESLQRYMVLIWSQSTPPNTIQQLHETPADKPSKSWMLKHFVTQLSTSVHPPIFRNRWSYSGLGGGGGAGDPQPIPEASHARQETAQDGAPTHRSDYPLMH